MKRFGFLILVLSLLFSSAAAEPLSVTDNLSDTITVLYNGEDASRGSYIYSYCYPFVTETDDLSSVCVNEYYRKKIQEDATFYIPSQADDYGDRSQSVFIDISYTVTCNNDDYFSVLIHRTEDVEGEEQSEIWEGNTFSRSADMVGSVTSLPQLLGKVNAGENDEWFENRQSLRVWEAMISLVWKEIEKNSSGIGFYPDLQKEDLEYIIDEVLSLDHDFYMDEDGNLVYFILPGRVAPPEAGLLTFTFTLDEIMDEM